MYSANPRSGQGNPNGAADRPLSDASRGVPALIGAVLLYLIVALAWSAIGRRDVEFARSAALACAFAAAAALVICIQAWFADRSIADATRGWFALTIASALASATSIASLVAVWSDGAVFWRPAVIRLFDGCAAAMFTVGVIALLGHDHPIRRLGAALPGAMTPLLAWWTSLAIAMQIAIDRPFERWSLLPAVCTAALASAGALIAYSSIDRDHPQRSGRAVGLTVAAAAWTATPFLLELGVWTDGPGVSGFARWLFPVAALGVAAAMLFPAPPREDGDRPIGLPRIVERAQSIRGKAISLALFALSVLAAVALDADVSVDLAVLAAIVAVVQFGSLLLELRAERERVLALLDSTEQLERLANVDMLTALPSRTALDQRLREEFERAFRYGQPMSICYVDVDHFKSVNDRYGHRTGDLVLQAIAESLDRTARSIDYVGRYGGEEFIVIAPGTWSEDARILAERLRAQVERIDLEGADTDYLRLTISVGIAGFPEHADSLDLLIERADQALYRSKELGRNRVSLWSSNDD
jgi:diguanylate cyclase (GGDEF)-like protein